MRKSRSLLLLAALLPILAGCVKLDGNLTISPMGTVSGKITYSLDKSLASQAGISSLEDFKKTSSKENENKVCSSENYLENQQSLIFECSFNSATLNDSDLKVQKSGTQISFYFNQSGSDGSYDLGSTSLLVNFPGDIKSISETKVGVTSKRSPTSALITASGTASFNVTIVADSTSPTSTSGNKDTGNSTVDAVRKQELLSAMASKIKISAILSASVQKTCSVTSGVLTPPSREPANTYLERAKVWETMVAPCLAEIDKELAKKNAPHPSPTPQPASAEVKSAFAAFSAENQSLTALLDTMLKTCKAMEKYASGLKAPVQPLLTGDAKQDEASLATFKTDVARFEALISKVSTVYNGPECKVNQAKKSAATPEEDVIEGEEIADYEITAKYLGSNRTRISLVATPNTNVIVLASKKGSKGKLSFKVRTDDQGNKTFQAPNNLRGYSVKLIEAGDEVASTSVL